MFKFKVIEKLDRDMGKSNFIQLNACSRRLESALYHFLVQFHIFVTTSNHINVFNYTKLYVLKGCGCKEMSLGSYKS